MIRIIMYQALIVELIHNYIFYDIFDHFVRYSSQIYLMKLKSFSQYNVEIQKISVSVSISVGLEISVSVPFSDWSNKFSQIISQFVSHFFKIPINQSYFTPLILDYRCTFCPDHDAAV